METKNAFSLLGKLSSVEEQTQLPGEDEYTQLVKGVDELTGALEHSSYPYKSRIKDTVNETLELFDLLRRHPYLLTRTSVGIFYGGGGTGAAVLPELLGRQTWAYVSGSAGIPALVYNAPQTDSMTATNYAGVSVPLSAEEYAQLIELPGLGVELGDVVRSSSIGGTLSHPNVNYFVFQPGSASSGVPDRALGSICSASIVFFDDLADGQHRLTPEELPDWINKRIGTDTEHITYVVYSDGDAASCRSVIERLQRASPNIRFIPASVSEMRDILLQSDVQSDNGLFSQRLVESTLSLQAYAGSEAEAHRDRAAMLAKDSIMQESEDSRLDMANMRRASHEAADQAEEQVRDLADIRSRLEDSVHALKNAIASQTTGTQEYGTPNPALIRGRYGSVYGESAMHAASVNDWTEAHRYMGMLRESGYPETFVYSLGMDQAMGSDPSDEDLRELRERLTSETVPSDRLLRTIIYFANSLGLSEEDIGTIASYRKSDLTADELYYRALFYQDNGDTGRAMSTYKQAVYAGSENAGDAILEHMDQYVTHMPETEFGTLQMLADNGVPEAAYRVSEMLEWPDDEKYANLAIAEGSESAIEKRAGELYWSVLDYYMASDEADSSKLDEAMRLFDYLDIMTIWDVDYPIAVLKYIDGDYVGAREHLDEGDHGLYFLGQIYSEGLGVSKDYDRALEYLAQSGLPEADELAERIEAEREAESVSSAEIEANLKEMQRQMLLADIEGYCDQFLQKCDANVSCYYPIDSDLRAGLGIPWNEDVYLSYDDSPFGTGTVGFAITERGFYVRHAFHSAEFLSYESAKGRYVSFDGFYKLMVGGFKAASLGTFGYNDGNLLYSLYDVIVDRLDEWD